MGFLVVTDNSGAFRLNSDLIMSYSETSNKDHSYHTHFTMQNGNVLKSKETVEQVDAALAEMGVKICAVLGDGYEG